MTTYYSEDHEWITVEGDKGMVGITDYAQNALGDIVFVEVPDVGAEFVKGDEIAVVESVKAASEIYTPVSGEVVDVNEALDEDPAVVNAHPETDGWFFKIKLFDTGELAGLMSLEDYKTYIVGLE